MKQIGPYQLHIVTDGTFRLDGGAMFGVIPKTLWSRTNQDVDMDNRILLGLNCLLISGRGENILVDTGVGNKLTEKEQWIYDLDHTQTTIVQSLTAIGLEKKDITKVVLTHLHFDHVGGATTYDNDGKIIPTFPNAEYIIQVGEWKNAFTGNMRARPSYKEENLVPLLESGLIHFVTEPVTEIADNIFMEVTHGHTRYHCIVKVMQNDETAIFLGDLIPTTNHLHMPYIAAYDEYPLTTIEVKQKLIEEAIQQNWYCVFEHDVCQPAGYLEWNEKKRAQVTKTYVTN